MYMYRKHSWVLYASDQKRLHTFRQPDLKVLWIFGVGAVFKLAWSQSLPYIFSDRCLKFRVIFGLTGFGELYAKSRKTMYHRILLWNIGYYWKRSDMTGKHRITSVSGRHHYSFSIKPGFITIFTDMPHRSLIAQARIFPWTMHLKQLLFASNYSTDFK